MLRTTGGISALAGAAALAATGRFGFAVPLGIAGLALLDLWPGMPAGFGRRWNKTPGQVSRVRTTFVEMELEHDTGAMRGRCSPGRHQGAQLDALDLPRSPACSVRSTRRVAPYSQRIWTAGTPAGVSTRTLTRQRGTRPRRAAGQ